MIEGVDISSYQPNYTPGPGVDFVIVKATEGTGYTNPYAASQLARARARGVVIGHYHYLHPGNPAGQARYFVANANALPGDVLACDWERTAAGDPSCADKDAFIREVQRLRPGHRVILYCNTYYWTSLDTTSFCGDGLWIADYRSRAHVTHPWLVWQYASKPIDKNRATFASRLAMFEWASVSSGGAGGLGGGGPAPTLTVAPTPPTPPPGDDDQMLTPEAQNWISGKLGSVIDQLNHKIDTGVPYAIENSRIITAPTGEKWTVAHALDWLMRACVEQAGETAAIQAALGQVATQAGIPQSDLDKIVAAARDAARSGAVAGIDAKISSATAVLTTNPGGNPS